MSNAIFYASNVDTLQRLLLLPLFAYGAWTGYASGNIVLASSFCVVCIAYIYGIIWERRRPLFAFESGALRVRDYFGTRHDINLDEITGLDESSWMGAKVFVNFEPLRLVVNRLSEADKQKFLNLLREKTGLEAGNRLAH